MITDFEKQHAEFYMMNCFVDYSLDIKTSGLQEERAKNDFYCAMKFRSKKNSQKIKISILDRETNVLKTLVNISDSEERSIKYYSLSFSWIGNYPHVMKMDMSTNKIEFVKFDPKTANLKTQEFWEISNHEQQGPKDWCPECEFFYPRHALLDKQYSKFYVTRFTLNGLFFSYELESISVKIGSDGLLGGYYLDNHPLMGRLKQATTDPVYEMLVTPRYNKYVRNYYALN